ncbi:hypothetical protein ES703_73115 [subsurface metagenome]
MPKKETDWLWNTRGNGCGLTPKIHFSAAWNTVERPIVTMITAMMGSPIIGRRMKTCIAMPRMNMNTSVIGMPIQNGTSYFASSAQHTQAPTSSSSPCAKLTTCVAL